MAQTKHCPKCNGTMSDGFVIDEGYGTRGVSSWVEGEPRKSIWVGVKLGGARKLEITTWRCDRCGYLESYAQEE
jgi:predicted nucleic-acid-binding Zn-ribbon protein